MISDVVRVRFAPSPTGYLHVGGLRTALYNYLFAKHNNGKFVLRIEDTDRNRYVEGAVENLITTMKWAGLDYDEGPEIGGEFGPYFQSQRLEIYNKYVNELIEKGNAYRCFCSAERIQNLREEQQAKKLQAKYDKHCLNLTKEEIEQKMQAGEQYVIRLNVPVNQRILIEDIVRGHVEFNSDTVDDQILIKSDGFPTYHLANVVDDHLMKITHVIRGEEWLTSTPKHVLLYDFFEWERPKFAHLPLLLNPDKSKLSKRQGDVAVEDYQKKGYLKEALINFVALLGWNAGDDVEIYEMEQLIEKFSLERVNKAGAVFNVEKLDWLNFEHLKNKPNEDILSMLKEELKNSKYAEKNFSDEYLLNVIESMKERVSFVKEFIEKSFYYFESPTEFDESVIQKRWKEDTPQQLTELRSAFEKLDNPNKEDFENALRSTAEKLNVGAGKLIHPLRLAVSGTGQGPGLFDLLFTLGKEEVIRRINTALETIKPN
ncbi:MAG TPA: glutamate--tRNA ligase [Ignavibacteria bacterium]|nr:glutamate--tRNA ligase [Ignavibacteria bacterium]